MLRISIQVPEPNYFDEAVVKHNDILLRLIRMDNLRAAREPRP